MTCEEFLITNTFGNGHLAYVEARQWRDEGWVWERIVAGWPHGIDLFWVVQMQPKMMWIILVLLMVVITTWISK